MLNNEGIYIPEVCETFTLREDHPDWKYAQGKDSFKYRVTGYLKPWVVPVRSEDDWLGAILDDANREFDHGNGPTKLCWCVREEAVYVTGSGISGTIRLVSDIVVTGIVPWSQEVIDEEREQARVLGRSGRVVF